MCNGRIRSREKAMRKSAMGLQTPVLRRIISIYGLVKVSTGILQPEKLSAGDASNRKTKLNAKDNKVAAFRAPVAQAA